MFKGLKRPGRLVVALGLALGLSGSVLLAQAFPVITTTGVIYVRSAVKFLFGDGTSSAPSMSFAAEPATGFYRYGSGKIGLASGGGALTPVFCIGANTASYPGFRRNSSNFEFVKCDESAYAGVSAISYSLGGNGFLLLGATAGQMRFVNAAVTVGTTIQVNAAPTCTANCGTSPSLAGSDSAGIVTMGATGVPASAFVITFGSTWASAPSCMVQSALASMVVGKMPIAVVTTTTTLTVTTNGTAPANADKYQYLCLGTQ